MQFFIERIGVFEASTGVQGRLSNAIETEFTYFYSTTDFNSPFFSFDPIISEAFSEAGYDVLSFESRLNQFLGAGFMPKGNNCQTDFAECTLNTGIISVVQHHAGSDEEEINNLLWTVKRFMGSGAYSDKSILTYRTPLLLDPLAPSSSPSASPVISQSPTRLQTNSPTTVVTTGEHKSTISFTYALEYRFDGHAPDILALLIDSVDMKVGEILRNNGYEFKFVSSEPTSKSLPGTRCFFPYFIVSL